MCVEPELIDDFERKLQAALARRPAPPHLKRKIMERRRQHAGRSHRMIWLERLAASLILAAAASGAAFWHHEVEQRRGEEAKQQVFTALRIANHALQQMNAQLAEHNRDAQ
jgi:hypothetical protein